MLVAPIVSTTTEMLKTVRWSGYRCLTRTVHWAHTPAAAMSIACPGPSSKRDIRQAAYETDNVTPFDNGSGRLTFQIEVRHARTKSAPKRPGRGSDCGRLETKMPAPTAITTPTYSRAIDGRPRNPGPAAVRLVATIRDYL